MQSCSFFSPQIGNHSRCSDPNSQTCGVLPTANENLLLFVPKQNQSCRPCKGSSQQNLEWNICSSLADEHGLLTSGDMSALHYRTVKVLYTFPHPEQSPKKSQLSGRQTLTRKNFPDKVSNLFSVKSA